MKIAMLRKSQRNNKNILCLYDSDRRIPSDYKLLYGTHFECCAIFLKERFPKVNGLEDTALVLKNDH